jgi:hypothetical protein
MLRNISRSYINLAEEVVVAVSTQETSKRPARIMVLDLNFPMRGI